MNQEEARMNNAGEVQPDGRLEQSSFRKDKYINKQKHT